MGAGRPNTFNKPQEIYKYFLDYKQYNIDNPTITKHYNVKTDSTGEVEHTPPLTMKGFNVYLYTRDICKNIYDYVNNAQNRYTKFTSIIRVIKDEMFVQKFAGASVGEYQHNIIARETGLVDKQEMEVKEVPMSLEDQIKRRDELLKKMKELPDSNNPKVISI